MEITEFTGRKGPCRAVMLCDRIGNLRDSCMTDEPHPLNISKCLSAIVMLLGSIAGGVGLPEKAPPQA